jgi:hypothetical protein
MSTIKVTIRKRVKGGPGSGNWGHAGRPGAVGGSAPRSQAMSVRSGQDWLERYQSAAGKTHPLKTQIAKAAEERQARQDLEGKLTRYYQEGKMSLSQVASELGISESDAQTIVGKPTEGKRKYTKYAQPDPSGGLDFYELTAGSAYKMRENVTEQPGRMVIDNTTGKMALAMDSGRAGIKGDYQDISYYGNIKAKPLQQVRLAKASILDPWRVEQAGTGRLTGTAADRKALDNITRTAEHLIAAGFPANQLLNFKMGVRDVSATLDQWVRGKVR